MLGQVHPRLAAGQRGGEPGIPARFEQQPQSLPRLGGQNRVGFSRFPVGQLGPHQVDDEPVEQGHRLQHRPGVQPGRLQHGQRELQVGQGGRPQRLAVRQRLDQPRVAVQQRPLLPGQPAQVGAPVAARLGRHRQLLADPLNHVVDQGLLVRHVAVQRHRAGPEPGRDRADGDRLQALGVADGHRGVDHLPPGVPRPRPPPPARLRSVVRHRASPPGLPPVSPARAAGPILPGVAASGATDCIIVRGTTYCVRD